MGKLDVKYVSIASDKLTGFGDRNNTFSINTIRNFGIVAQQPVPKNKVILRSVANNTMT